MLGCMLRAAHIKICTSLLVIPAATPDFRDESHDILAMKEEWGVNMRTVVE